MLIGAAKDAEEELGVELDAERERAEDADIFETLRMRLDELPTEPLTQGRWR